MYLIDNLLFLLKGGLTPYLGKMVFLKTLHQIMAARCRYDLKFISKQ